jgi:CheY-like chemotaxis protein
VPKILVVDDSLTQLTLLAGMLQERGNTVMTANDGQEAVECLGKELPDLVVTDMQMPNVNGVELIKQMHSTCPLVPTILVTAFGSEELAAEALGTGAANYIAKDHIGSVLPEAAARVIRFAQANAECLDLKGALTRRSFDFTIDCLIERVEPLTCLLIRMLASMNVLHSSDRIRICEAIHYLLFYSIIHGNLEHPISDAPMSNAEAIALVSEKQSDPNTKHLTERVVQLQIDVDQRAARFTVSHDGQNDGLLRAPLPGTPESFVSERGRGMMLMTSVMDEVRIDPSTFDVTLVKYLK